MCSRWRMFHKMGRTGIPACSHCRDSHPTRIASFFFFFLSVFVVDESLGRRPSVSHPLWFGIPSFFFSFVLYYVCHKGLPRQRSYNRTSGTFRANTRFVPGVLKGWESSCWPSTQMGFFCFLFCFWQSGLCVQQTVVHRNEVTNLPKKTGTRDACRVW